MNQSTKVQKEKVDDLQQANNLMVEALELLDRTQHPAAAYLDHAIVKLGLRPAGEGFPPE